MPSPPRPAGLQRFVRTAIRRCRKAAAGCSPISLSVAGQPPHAQQRLFPQSCDMASRTLTRLLKPDISHSMARKSVTYRQKAAKGDERRLENSNPEAAAEIAERVAEEPWLVISEMAYKLGLAPQTVQALIDRLKTRYQPVVAEIRKVT